MIDDGAIHVTRLGPPPSRHLVEVDDNGCPVERRVIDGIRVVIHYDDLPECDRDVVDGIPCTSAIRTIIDIAPDCPAGHLDAILRDGLASRLFALDEMVARIAADDMTHRPGAGMVRASLQRLGLT